MKIVWEGKDLKPGMVVAAKNSASERWMIGYAQRPEGRNWALISLQDGMVLIFAGEDNIVRSLNESYVPELMVELIA